MHPQPPHIHGLLTSRDHISHQPFHSRLILPSQHHHRTDLPMLSNNRLDLTRLDPEPPDLHLIINPTQILQLPINHPPHQIPGAIHPLTRPTKRTRHKPLSSQPRTTQITPSQPHPSNKQLPRNTHRHRTQHRIQHIHPSIRDRPTNQRCFSRRQRVSPRRHHR
jgi:hypothetical protein